ncbi:MAG: hypothetical protein GWP63_00635 [Haliea sp.]|jgi:signal transduction histidine kinase|nr:hypothetical protein [Haliea sp.]
MTASLQRRLILILLGLTLFVWLASAMVTYFSVGRALQEQIDQQLEQYSHLVIYISRVFARQIDEGLPLYESWGEHGLEQLRLKPMVVDSADIAGVTPAVNIWLGDTLIAVMEGSPEFERPSTAGFSYMGSKSDGGRWRVYTRYDEVSDLWIRVGVEFGAARWSMLATLGREFWPLLFILPLTIAVLYIGVSRGLTPLNNLALQISRRKPGLLDPVATAGVPVEVAGVVDAINRLLHRLEYALEGERRFTANAAHELMTPLAAIKTEVQLCQKQLEGIGGEQILPRIALRVDRASHSVEQLLTLARLDPDAPPPDSLVRLRSLLQDVLADTAHLASDRGLEIALSGECECEVSGSEESLAILLRNLLTNAFRYAAEGSEVRIALHCEGDVALEISNDCAPLPESEFALICDRFYRVPGSQGLGVGLGLSIVSRIADQHGAHFRVAPGEDGSGFCARVSFPPA